ncbi:hypothetical protein [Flavobacterium panacagri]|uniref:hypothetical protein n=1 Tax=Flavobacterium panacagri TaxID=3034146 RepID=UPI0025A61B5F|nr:hypothetical protein [Flavobacterium panacagri]
MSSKPPDNRKSKVSRCILDRINLRVRKIAIACECKYDAFNSNKKTNLSLDYAEAHYLEELLIIYAALLIQDDFLARNDLQLMITFLNQKLA